MLGGEISARYVPAAALLLALAVIDLSFAVRGMAPAASSVGIAGFLQLSGSWRLVADLLVISLAGGVFIVPLYAFLQTLGDAGSRSRDVAANNVVNAADLAIWKAQFGMTGLATGASGAVPEPAGAALAVIGLMAAAQVRRKRS